MMSPRQIRGAAAVARVAGGARGRRGPHRAAARVGRARAVPGRQVLRAHPHAALRQVHEVGTTAAHLIHLHVVVFEGRALISYKF